MSRKHAELEREFIEDLEPRTGRSLADWMSLIDGAGLTDRNAIIDWLRPQGLTFAHASWLERIHHNGGRPIYGEISERPPAPAPVPAKSTGPRPAAAAQPPPRPVSATPAAAALTPPLAPALAPSLAAANPAVAELMARGKGLRPLAEMLLREIAQALPGLVAAPAGDLVSLQRPAEFGVLLVGPRELRLGLDLGDWPAEGPLSRSRITGAAARITHMTVIDDARQITASLIGLAQRADARVNTVS